jgi:hypothetical protein
MRAGDQPVKQHADGGEMLLHRRLFKLFSERLDVSGDMQRLDLVEGTKLVMVAPGEETTGRMQIRRPGILVADGHGEEFEEPFRRGVAGRRRRSPAPRSWPPTPQPIARPFPFRWRIIGQTVD